MGEFCESSEYEEIGGVRQGLMLGEGYGWGYSQAAWDLTDQKTVSP
jgi:hypothetical protein